MPDAEDDVVLKLLHTADWHLGHRFPQFDRRDQDTLTQARLETVKTVFQQARALGVDVVICAGDLFDTPTPTEPWWQGLLDHLQQTDPKCPILLLPGNHDALTPESVYQSTHPFRRQLPGWVHVIDDEQFVYELGDEAVIYGVPCCSRAGATDPTTQLPARDPADRRIRIAVVHGSTADIAGFEQNFPIDPTRAKERGFDYLALGDTHSFHIVQDRPPAVYPGAPEPTSFGEVDPGNVAVALFFRSGRPPHVQARRVARWRWRDERCDNLDAVRRLLEEKDLRETVLRLCLNLEVSLTEQEELEELLEKLQGTEAIRRRAGVLLLDRSGVRTAATVNPDDFPDDLPEVLQGAISRLQGAVTGPDGEKAKRALFHLHRLLRQREQGD